MGLVGKSQLVYIYVYFRGEKKGIKEINVSNYWMVFHFVYITDSVHTGIEASSVANSFQNSASILRQKQHNQAYMEQPFYPIHLTNLLSFTVGRK